MKIARCVWTVAALILSLIASRQTATAQPAEREPIHVSFDAPANCPSVDDFARQIKQRTDRAVLVAQTQSGVREFVVKISPASTGSEHGYVGTVVVDGTRSSELKAPMCATVVDGLALISALAIDPDALTKPPSEDGTATGNTNTGTGTGTGTDTNTHTDTHTATPTDTNTATGTRTPSIELRADGALGIAIRVAPRIMPTATIGITATYQRFSVRLSGTAGWRTTAVDAPGFADANTSYRWLTARVQTCFDAVRATKLEVAGCIGFESGTLRVAAHDIVNATASNRLWLAPQLGLRSALALGHSRWRATVQVSANAPIIRDRYQFQPATTVAQTSAITVAVDFGAALHF